MVAERVAVFGGGNKLFFFLLLNFWQLTLILKGRRHQILGLLKKCLLSTGQLDKFKGRPILFPDIVDPLQAIKVVDEMEHLFICLIVIKGHNGYSIVYLEGKGVD